MAARGAALAQQVRALATLTLCLTCSIALLALANLGLIDSDMVHVSTLYNSFLP